VRQLDRDPYVTTRSRGHKAEKRRATATDRDYSGVPCAGLELYGRPGRVVFAFPTNNDLVGLFVGFPIGDLAAVRADIEGHMLAAVAALPDLAERVRGGRREERLYGATQLPNVLRKPWGRGWALVGDAGCHKDPFMALGICDALRDAELLADALTDGLSGRRPTADALADYERRRDDATREEFRANLARAQLGPLPGHERRLRAALASTRTRRVTSSSRCRAWSPRSRSSTTRTSTDSSPPLR
jgi:flavin-dependent dehydrogenase